MKILRTLMMLSALALSPVAAQAVVYFDSDFNVALPPNGGGFNSEGWQVFGNNTGWGDGNTSGTIGRVGTTGTALVLHWKDPQPANGNGGVMQVNHRFPDTTVAYGRMYYSRSTPFNTCNSADPNWLTVIKPHCGSDALGNNNVKIVFTEGSGSLGLPGNNPRLITGTSFGVYSYDLQSSYDNWPCPHPDGPTHKCGQSTLFRSNVAPTTNTSNPDLVEWAIILNTPGQQNGSGFLWVNGILKVSLTNREFIGPSATSKDRYGQVVSSLMKYGNFQFVAQNQAAYGSSHYFDRIAAGNTRIGPAGGVITPDTTPPNTPTGLQVQ